MKLDIDFRSKEFIIGASGLTLIAVALLLYLFVLAGSNSGSNPESHASQLAVCLTEQGVTMYSLPTCPHCQEQKDKFGDAFKYVDSVNCSENRDKCLNQEIENVPTWIIDGEKFVGVQELEELAAKTSCEYP